MARQRPLWTPTAFEDEINAIYDNDQITFDEYNNEDNYGLKSKSFNNNKKSSTSSSEEYADAIDTAAFDARAQLKVNALLNKVQQPKKVCELNIDCNIFDRQPDVNEDLEITRTLRRTGIDPEIADYRLCKARTRKTVPCSDGIKVNGLHDVYLNDDFFKLKPVVPKKPLAKKEESTSSKSSCDSDTSTTCSILSSTSSTSLSSSSSSSEQESTPRQDIDEPELNAPILNRYAELSIGFGNEEFISPRQLYFLKSKFNS